MELRISLIQREGQIPALPQYQTENSAARDIAAFLPQGAVTLLPGQRARIPTGLKIAVPAGYGGFLLARSGLSSRDGIALANGVGLIDPDYRGEVQVSLVNLSNQSYTIKNGDRIAQLVLLPAPQFDLTVQAELEETARGEGGFGSTKK